MPHFNRSRIVLGLALAGALAAAGTFRAPHQASALVPLAAASEPAIPQEAGSKHRPGHHRRSAGGPHRRHPRTRHPRARHPRTRRATPFPEQKVDLNSAGAEKLAHIRVVGDWLAGQIVAFRAMNGPFESLDELADVDGISERRIEVLSRYLVVR